MHTPCQNYLLKKKTLYIINLSDDKIFDMIFEYKMMAKKLRSEADSFQHSENELTQKIKDFISQNSSKDAKTNAQEILKNRNNSKKYVYLASKLEAVHDRLLQAQKSNHLTEEMKEMTAKMNSAITGMDLDTVSSILGNYEKIFEGVYGNVEGKDEDFKGKFEDNDVNDLIGNIGNQNNLKFGDQFPELAEKNKQEGDNQENGGNK